MRAPSFQAGDGLRPDLTELIALREAVRSWPPARRAAVASTGPASSPLRGRGMDYAESRPYSPGDEVRHVDWRVSARTGRMHTKVFHAERERTTLLVCDTSPRLFFGTRVRFKSVQAARAGALMAWAAQRAGDRITALRAGAAEPPLPPASGVRGALQAVGRLAAWYAQAGEEGLDRALRSAGRLLHPGARVIMLADPHSMDTVPDTRLAALSAHMDVACVLLVDPLEMSPPARRLAFQADQRITLDLAEASVMDAWGERFAERVRATQERLGRLRIGSRVLCSDHAVERLLDLWLPGRSAAA